jgi:hypothetical protein
MIVHLALVTLGVLIALSFEGVATWREHRALVREARANLTSEIRDNLTELKGQLASLPQHRKDLGQAIAALQVLLDHKKLEGQVQLGFENADLQNASHRTAEVTGAFALMEYDEAKKYASVYGHQELYQRMQNDLMQTITRTMAAGTILASPETATTREIEDCKTQMRLALAALDAQEQIGQALLRDYERALQER